MVKILVELINMDFKKLKIEVCKNAKKYGEKYDIDIDEEFVMLKLFEEMGEFSEALLTYKNKSRPDKQLPKKESEEELAKELADVVGMAMVVAEVYDVDLEEAMKKKWLKR